MYCLNLKSLKPKIMLRKSQSVQTILQNSDKQVFQSGKDRNRIKKKKKVYEHCAIIIMCSTIYFLSFSSFFFCYLPQNTVLYKDTTINGAQQSNFKVSINILQHFMFVYSFKYNICSFLPSFSIFCASLSHLISHCVCLYKYVCVCAYMCLLSFIHMYKYIHTVD